MMLDHVANDFRLYWHLVGLQIRSQWQYKVNFVVELIATFSMTVLEFFVLLLFFIPFPSLLGWKVGDVAFQTAMIAITFGLAELFGSGLDEFPWLIRQGDFDRVMLRPAGLLIQVMSNKFLLRRIGRLIQGGVAFGVAFSLLPNLIWTPAKCVVLILGVTSGSLIFVSILLIGATICFWTIETTELTNLLYYGGREMMTYPLTIYHHLLQRLFLFVIPIAFGSYVPACYILSHPLPFGLPAEVAFFSPLPALGFALLAWLFWGFGVRHYQSTGN